MVFLAFEWATGNHGAGSHQWDLSFAAVQYDLRVCPFKQTFPATTQQRTNQSDIKLRRYVLLRFDSLRQTLHPPANSSDLPLCRPRYFLLAHPPIDRGQHDLLHNFLLRRDIPLPSSRKDLEPSDARNVPRQQNAVHLLCGVQCSIGYRHAFDPTLLHLGFADEYQTQNWHFGHFRHRFFVRYNPLFEQLVRRLTFSGSACISSLLRLLYQVKLNRTQTLHS